MKITFSYDIDKDVENFLKSSQSINNKKPTKLQDAYSAKFGEEIDAAKAKAFIEAHQQENNIDPAMAMAEIEKQWRAIESEFIRRAENIFGAYPSDIHAYLSTNSRCTYSIEQSYFFVFIGSKNTNVIIMHELWHFYAYHRFHIKLTEKGVSPEKYNDIKESLTELLNLEFKDLMDGQEDKGYPQHAAMREIIKEAWVKDKNIDSLVTRL